MYIPITNKTRGILHMLISASSMSLMQALVGLQGSIFSTSQLVFTRSVITCLIAGIVIHRKGGSLLGTREQQPALLFRSVTGMASMVALFYASAHALQADVAIIAKINPFFVTILAVIFLKEHLNKMLIPALLIAFAGASYAAQPAMASNLKPILAALFSAVSAAVAYTLLSYFKGKADAMTVVFHFAFFCSLCTLPGTVRAFVMPTLPQFLVTVVLGLCGAVTQITLTYAYRYAPAAEVSVYNYAGIIFSMLFGYLILAEPISMHSAVGGGTVIFASVLMYVAGRGSSGEEALEEADFAEK